MGTVGGHSMSAIEGILYVATGPQYLAEAAANLKAARPHLGNCSVAVVTDDVPAAEALGCFDLCLPHPDPRHSYRDKIPALIDLPFDKTLFLDSDARIIGPVEGLFQLLDQFDLAAAHAPVRLPSGWSDSSVPPTFPELNSGVLLLNRSKQQQSLIQRWLEQYDAIGQDWDQATFRAVVWEFLSKDLHLGILPPEANLRTTKPWIAGKGLSVSIVHGRVPDDEWPHLIQYLNGDIDSFRTNTEWRSKHPATTLTPRVAPSKRDQQPAVTNLAEHYASVSTRWNVDNDAPLSCEDPIFILAAGWRAGSTVLQRMLANDPALMIWDEPHDRAQIIQSLSAQWLPFTEQWPNKTHQASLETQEPPSDSWLASRSPSVRHLRQTHRLFLDNLFATPAREINRPRWGLKEVRLGAEHVAYLQWLYPASRFVLLVRNPFDAYASYKEHGPSYFQWPEGPIAGAAAFGRIWSQLATEFHALSGHAQCMLLRYEDLEASTTAIRNHTGLTEITKPSELSVQTGDATRHGTSKLSFIERTQLAKQTKHACSLLGY